MFVRQKENTKLKKKIVVLTPKNALDGISNEASDLKTQADYHDYRELTSRKLDHGTSKLGALTAVVKHIQVEN